MVLDIDGTNSLIVHNIVQYLIRTNLGSVAGTGG